MISFTKTFSDFYQKAKPTFKMLLAFWSVDTVEKRIRSFNAENLEFVDQMAAKLPAIKLWEWYDPGRTRIQPTGSSGARARLQTFL